MIFCNELDLHGPVGGYAPLVFAEVVVIPEFRLLYSVPEIL